MYWKDPMKQATFVSLFRGNRQRFWIVCGWPAHVWFCKRAAASLLLVFYFDSSLDFSENDVTLGEKARWGYVLDFQGRRKNWDHGSCVQLLILLVVLK